VLELVKQQLIKTKCRANSFTIWFPVKYLNRIVIKLPDQKNEMCYNSYNERMQNFDSSDTLVSVPGHSNMKEMTTPV
jgi:hypothetical protein